MVASIPPLSAPLVELVRGPLVEAVHTGTIAVVDASGRLLGSVGDPLAKVTYWRSSAKPWQAMPLILSGAAQRYGLDAADIAICTASHNGEPIHVERVAQVLAKMGLTPEVLACGTHLPLGATAAGSIVRAGVEPSQLHNNCSGMHAAMLGTARHTGAPLDGYAEPDHPVHARILDAISTFTGLDAADVIVGMDDCAAPCYGLSVYHMALAYARLMRPEPVVDEAHSRAATTIRDAMTTHPDLIAGSGRIDTDLMVAAAGAIVAKGGASGVQCVGHADGIGIALKIDDGATGPWPPARPTSVAIMEVLRQLELLEADALEALRAHGEAIVTDRNGRTVGEGRPVFSLEGHRGAEA